MIKQLKKNQIKIWRYFLLLIFLAGACRAAYVTGIRSSHVTVKELDSLQLEDCTKLMIVAHPDDETIWGGAHLADKGYFVVCLTDGYNKTRRNEFQNTIKESGNKGLILRYPDKVHGERSNWAGDKKDIIKDLDTILTYKHWNMVVTHNPEGEYGHIHHEMTSQLVTQEYYRNYQKNDLYYFGQYYKKKVLPEVESSLRKVSSENEAVKKSLLENYKSQQKVVDMFAHMIPYEEWIQSGANRELRDE